MNKTELKSAAQQLGSRGGKARAKNYPAKQLKKWAKLGAKFGKLGGRPKGSKNKKAKVSK